MLVLCTCEGYNTIPKTSFVYLSFQGSIEQNSFKHTRAQTKLNLKHIRTVKVFYVWLCWGTDGRVILRV